MRHRFAGHALAALFVVPVPLVAASIPAAHVHHNHMPNFWLFYGVDVSRPVTR